ncbi:hypothetical protein [Nocardiopsis sp. CNT312]|uniref:hypothetical protein n=1 Tax=Nocardiopsis sp. CNT312 TaxID=1137268 RepID=UPI0004ADF998|nr:hypothetical protein [Nocardiopsis sp. CNT312]
MPPTRNRAVRSAPGRSALLLLLSLTAVLVWAAPACAHTPARTGTADGPVVLVGVPGLLWEDVTARDTPTLWRMAERASIANVSIRTATSRTCPTDGWLSVSAGQRAFSLRERFTVCEPAPRPQPVAAPSAVGGLDGVLEHDPAGDEVWIPGYGSFVQRNDTSVFEAPVGLLGQAVRDSGGSTLAVGPGAALGAADASGRVDRYLDRPEDLTPGLLRGAALTVVELPELTRLYPSPPESGDGPADPDDVPAWERDTALATIDARLRALIRILPEGASLMVVGVSMDTGPSELTVALSGEAVPGGVESAASFLASDSTRRAGLVALTDTTPTVLAALGLDSAPPTSGRVWHTAERPPTTEAAVARLVEFNTAATVVGAAIPGFFSGLVAVQLLIYAAAAGALHRYSDGQRAKRALVLSVTRVVALAGASFPVASYLANLVPWWTSPVPFLSLLGCVVAADALVVTLAVAGPWRRSVLGPMTVVAGATTAVLFLDLCFGARLQMNATTGYSPIVAGRFYGIGNIAFATFATGMLMAVAGGAHVLISRGYRRTAVAVALAVGSATVLIVGWPGLGTDFGGVIALVPGLAVTAMMIAGVRITPARLGAACATGVVVIGALAWSDLQRPPTERSHFGTFAAQVVGGEAGTVLVRKLAAMLGTFGNWQLTLLAGCALLFLFVVLNRPTNWRMGALQCAYEHAPTLRAGLTGSLVTALAGFAVNDSGVAIPAIALTVAVPLTLSACVWALQREDPVPPGPPNPVEGLSTHSSGRCGRA